MARAWHVASEPRRVWLCGAYLHFAGGFEPPEVEVLVPEKTSGSGDPLYAVFASKLPPHAIEVLR